MRGIEAWAKESEEQNLKVLATKEDISSLRADLLRTIYGVGIVQLIGIIISVLMIVRFTK